MDAAGNSKILFYSKTTESAFGEWESNQTLIDNFWEGMTSTEVTNQLSCNLHRQEEINLYYQCTQNAYNGYALDHFGGDMRSYPRWIFEFKRCNLMLAKAECCTIQRDGIDYECPPCTDITLPMPQPFGEKPTGPVAPVLPPVKEECAALPDMSMYSVYRPMYVNTGVETLFRDQFQYWCVEQRPVSKYEATLTIKMVGNAKTEPNYNIRLNQDDCTTIELKAFDAEDYLPGGELAPYGAPFTKDSAFFFKRWDTDIPDKYDAKVGQCICDDTTGVCEAFLSEGIEML